MQNEFEKNVITIETWLREQEEAIATMLKTGEPHESIKAKYLKLFATALGGKTDFGHLLAVTHFICDVKERIEAATAKAASAVVVNGKKIPAPAKTAAAKPFRLVLQQIRDPGLRFEDRIIYSLVRGWSWANQIRAQSNRPSKPITVYRLRKKTGFRIETIQKSIDLLVQRNYLAAGFIPINGDSDKRLTGGFWKLEFVRTSGSLRRQIFRAVIGKNKADGLYRRPSWYATSLGIHRATYFRWKT